MGYVANGRLQDLIDPDACEFTARDMAESIGDAFESNVRRLTPRDNSPDRDPSRGLHIADTIERTRVRKAGSTYRGEVFTEHPAAPYAEWDTVAHDIRPRADREAASVLETGRPRGTVQDGRAALSWRSGGTRVFAKVVHHPGTQGAHMFSRGAAVTQQELDRVCAPALRHFERLLIGLPRRPVRVGKT